MDSPCHGFSVIMMVEDDFNSGLSVSDGLNSDSYRDRTTIDDFYLIEHSGGHGK